MTDVLIFADTVRSPELRHEVPVSVPDPFVYAERNGSRYAFVGSLEVPRLQALDGLQAVPLEQLGADELIAQGLRWPDSAPELLLRACRRIGIEDAVVPRSFPLEQADYVREHGIRVRPDGEFFDRRRRVKSEAELAGIGRAIRSAEAAFDAVRARLRRGGSVTCEELRSEAMRVFSETDTIPPDILIVSHGAQTAIGHEPGHGAIAPGEPVVADLSPRDAESGCYADLTRTFCLGEPPDELVEYHRLCREALERSLAAVRAGVRGSEPFGVVCELFQEHGYRTQLTKQPGEVLEEGFFHGLGHGIGLEVHEEPYLGRNGGELVAGDVLAVEPGLYRKGFGGVRLEDDVLVTADGCERLTDYPYDLAP